MLGADVADIKQPAFGPDISVEIKDRQVLITSSEKYVVLEGALSVAITQHLNQGLSFEEVVDTLSEQYPPEEVYFLLMRLTNDGFIVDASIESTPASAFWHSLDFDAQAASRSFTKKPINIQTLGIDTGDFIEQHLTMLGVNTTTQANNTLLLVSSYLHPDLPRTIELMHAQDNTPLLAKPAGSVLWIGPYISSSGSCLQCLQHRLSLNQPALVYQSEQGLNGSHSEAASFISPICHGILALETAKWLIDHEKNGFGDALVTIDLRTLETRRHAVTRQPQCKICGNDKEVTEYGLRLQSRTVYHHNNYRIIPSHITLQQYESIVSPITGVVRSLNRVETEDAEFAITYTAGHSGRHKGHSIKSLRLATRDQSGGKGKTDTQARTSALCEAVERYSAVFDNDPIAVRASFDELSSDAIHPAALLLFSDAQYADRETWNAKLSGRFQFVPSPFDPTVKIDWTQAWSLTHDAPRLIPTAYCYYGFDGPGSSFCRADSNGLSSGNCMEEAILFGFLELVERDAVSIWWYNRGQYYPAVDLHSFEDPFFEMMYPKFKDLDRDLWVLDLTTDLEIPTFVAISPKIKGKTEDILLGFGTHFNAQIAITRALLEVNQSLPAVLKEPHQRKTQLLPDFADVLNWWDTARRDNQPFLTPNPILNPKAATDYNFCMETDLKIWIEAYVDRAYKLGLETIVLDMTRPDVGLSVARVMVPGLRHFWRRLAPGRIYEVPAKMGWANSPMQEEDLNPISLFL